MRYAVNVNLVFALTVGRNVPIFYTVSGGGLTQMKRSLTGQKGRGSGVMGEPSLLFCSKDYGILHMLQGFQPVEPTHKNIFYKPYEEVSLLYLCFAQGFF